jgi:Tol biopolymer transport system component
MAKFFIHGLLVLCAIAVLSACGKPIENAPVNNFPTATPTTDPARQPTATFAPTAEALTSENLPGQLYFVQSNTGLFEVNLLTGERTQLWQLAEKSFLAGLAIPTTPDRKAVFSYAPPPPAGKPQLGLTDLWQANLDGTSAEVVQERRADFESFAFPVWSPAGEWLYFSHAKPILNDAGLIQEVKLTIERVPSDDLTATPQVVVSDAEQISFSADGTRIAYQKYDPKSYTRAVMVADADGKNAVELVSGSWFFAVASVQISPDGQSVLFAASGPLTRSVKPVNPFVLLFEPSQRVEAHGPPWEIWQVPTNDPGNLTQLTNIATDNPWVVWAPTGEDWMVLQPGAVLLGQAGADPRYITLAEGHGEMQWIVR